LVRRSKVGFINPKGKIMKLSQLTMILLLGATMATPSFAQQGPGMGGGMGGMGPGNGSGKGMGFTFNRDNTRGWSLMTTEERAAHREKMLAAKTYDECKAVQDEQHKAMAVRAKEKGATLPAARQNGCDRMKARGFFK
jgi:hypothetical protein